VLSKNKTGAFNKLMRWQMTGDGGVPVRTEPKPSEEEEIEYDLETDDVEEEEEASEKDGKGGPPGI
jgi:putative ABC transport system ATP-binding protein